jgi:hypothetical protein
MIIAVAVQTDDGWTMSLHPPARHADLIVKACKIRNMKPFRGKQGFINDKWEFLTRERGSKRGNRMWSDRKTELATESFFRRPVVGGNMDCKNTITKNETR